MASRNRSNVAVVTPVAAAIPAAPAPAPVAAPVAAPAVTPTVVTPPPVAPGSVADAAAHRVATAAELGAAFARAALRDASDVTSFAESVKALKAHEVYAAYTTFRDQFQEAAKSAGYAAAEKLWSRTWGAARVMGYLADYPKSPAPEAVAKQTQAAKKTAAVAAIVKGKTPLELVAESRKASEKGDISKAADLLQAAKKLQDEANKAAKAKAEAATKLLRERIVAAVGRLASKGDVKSLTKLVEMAERMSPIVTPQPATV